MRLRTSSSIFSSSRSMAVMICTICWRIVSRSSMNSTSSLATSTSVIWWESLTIFSRLSRIILVQVPFPARSLPQYQLAVPRQVLFHLFVHFLVRNSGAAHLILPLHEDLAHFLVQPVFDRQLFDHALANPRGHRLFRLGLNLPAFHQALHDFIGHVGHKIPYEQHPYSFLGVNVSKSVYWQRGESARNRGSRKTVQNLQQNAGFGRASRNREVPAR